MHDTPIIGKQLCFLTSIQVLKFRQKAYNTQLIIFTCCREKSPVVTQVNMFDRPAVIRNATYADEFISIEDRNSRISTPSCKVSIFNSKLVPSPHRTWKRTKQGYRNFQKSF